MIIVARCGAAESQTCRSAGLRADRAGGAANGQQAFDIHHLCCLEEKY